MDSNSDMTFDLYTVDSSGNATHNSSWTEYFGTSYDQLLQAEAVVDGSGAPVSGEQVQIRALPLNPSSQGSGNYPLLGNADTDSNGFVVGTVDATPILNNPAYESVNSVVDIGVFVPASGDTMNGPIGPGSTACAGNSACDSGGNGWYLAGDYPEYVGGDNDPIMLTKQVYADGSPVSGASLEAYAVPIGASGSGVSGYPLLGSGITAPDGTIHMAPLDLSGVQQNPTYETSGDTVDIRIEYDACATGTDTSVNCTNDPAGDGSDTGPIPDWQTAMDINEYFGTAYDAVLAQTQALDGNGNPVIGMPITIEAVSQDGGDTIDVGSGTTDDSGYVIAPIDATSLEGDSTYQDQDNLDLNLSVVAQSGNGGTETQLYSDSADGGSTSLQAGINIPHPLPTGGLTCDMSEDPSGYTTASMAEACGYSMSAREQLLPLAGGGTRSVFYDDGAETDQFVPPAGFDATTASDAMLSAYEFPPRPSDPTSSAYAAWVAQVSGVTFEPPLLFEVLQSQSDTFAGEDSAGETSKPECGFPTTPNAMNCTTSGGYYHIGGLTSDVYMAYVQPVTSQDARCDTRFQDAVFWTGIGGISTSQTSALAQAGSDTLGSRDLFTEVISKDSNWGPSNWVHAQGGDLIEVETRLETKFEYGANKFVFWLAYKTDHTHGKATIVTHNESRKQTFNPGNAQWVVERPQVSQFTGLPLTMKKSASLPNFRNLDVKAATRNGGNLSTSAADSYLAQMYSRMSTGSNPHLVQDSVQLAQSEPGGGSGSDGGYWGPDVFRATWKHC